MCVTFKTEMFPGIGQNIDSGNTLTRYFKS